MRHINHRARHDNGRVGSQKSKNGTIDPQAIGTVDSNEMSGTLSVSTPCGDVPVESTLGSAAFRTAPQRNPAGNALTYGLTAGKIPPAASRAAPRIYQQALPGELGATSVLENILAEEMARHAAGMEFAAQAEEPP